MDLNKEQSDQLISTITKKKFYNYHGIPYEVACLAPNFGVIFYNSTNKVICHIDVSIDCKRIQVELFNFPKERKEIIFYYPGEKLIKKYLKDHSLTL